MNTSPSLRVRPWTAAGCLALASGALTSGSAWAGVPITIASFTLLQPPPGHPQGGANQISADGSTVVGWAWDSSFDQSPARWRHGTSLIGETLLLAPGTPFLFAEANAASADGSVVVGTWFHSEGGQEQGFRWVQPGPATTIPDLGILLGSSAEDVSSDGQAVTGYALNPAQGFRREAMRWTSAGGMVPLGVASTSGGDSIGLGISGDGMTIVGETNSNNVGFCGMGYGSGFEGFDLALPGGTMNPRGMADSRFEGVSADAGTFVGAASVFDPVPQFCEQRPGRFRPGTGWEIFQLPCFDFAFGTAYDASADGRVVVGVFVCGDTQSEAFVWYEGDVAVRPLKPELESLGLTINADLTDAVGVSDDGTSITGTANVAGIGLMPYIVTLPIPDPPCVADVDDGTGTGTPDGGITIDDLLYFLLQFDAGNLAVADVDDGSGTGTPDGGVTIDDLIYFLIRFDAGC